MTDDDDIPVLLSETGLGSERREEILAMAADLRACYSWADPNGRHEEAQAFRLLRLGYTKFRP